MCIMWGPVLLGECAIYGLERRTPDDESPQYLPTSWYDPRVEIRLSTIQGGGMFARAPFVPGETVAIVGGTLMTGAEFAAYL